MKRLALLSLLLFPLATHAGIVTGRSGILAQCTSGCADDATPTAWLLTSPGPVIFIFDGTGTVNFTQEQSAHQGAAWVATGVTATTPFPVRSQLNVGVGLYRWAVDCTGTCTYTIYFQQDNPYLW